jgi:hypothetical protein
MLLAYEQSGGCPATAGLFSFFEQQNGCMVPKRHVRQLSRCTKFVAMHKYDAYMSVIVQSPEAE